MRIGIYFKLFPKMSITNHKTHTHIHIYFTFPTSKTNAIWIWSSLSISVTVCTFPQASLQFHHLLWCLVVFVLHLSPSHHLHVPHWSLQWHWPMSSLPYLLLCSLFLHPIKDHLLGVLFAWLSQYLFRMFFQALLISVWSGFILFLDSHSKSTSLRRQYDIEKRPYN